MYVIYGRPQNKKDSDSNSRHNEINKEEAFAKDEVLHTEFIIKEEPED